MQPATAGGVGLIQPHRQVSHRTASPHLRLPDPKLVVANEEARRIPDSDVHGQKRTSYPHCSGLTPTLMIPPREQGKAIGF